MKIQKIKFNDKVFLNLIQNYILNSHPIPEIDYSNSLLSKKTAIDKYVKFLSGLDLSIAAKDSNDQYLFFVFVSKKEEKELDLEFCFPAINIMEDFVSSRLCFYNLCLYAMDFFKIEKMQGTIRRSSKKNPFKSFLKRYIKAITYKTNNNSDYDCIFLDKKSITKHCEKLKSKSNRN